MIKKLKSLIIMVTAIQASFVSADVLQADSLFTSGQYSQAKAVYLEAAKLGNPHAYYKLAQMNFKGLGGEKDLVNALMYYSLAAEYNFHNAEKVINKVLASLPEEAQVTVNNAIAEYKVKYGKAAINKQLFPELKSSVLANKITFDGKEKLEKKFFSDDFVEDSIAGFTNADLGGFSTDDEEDDSSLDISLMSTPKEPFLIVDLDIASDGSIRNYSEVQKLGNSLSASRLLNEFILFPQEKPEFQKQYVDFVHRVYIGAATYSKFTMVEENQEMYSQIRSAAKRLKSSTVLNERYQYAMALLNFPWVADSEANAEQEAEQLLLTLAKLGHPGAMYEYGLMLYREQRNIADAIHWISQASKYGLTRAEYRLAKILQSSPWVKNDEKKALFWYQQAAKKDYVPAIIRAIEIKLTAQDENLKDLAGAIEALEFIADKHKDNPEYFYLLALSHKDRENRDYTQVVNNLRKAIMKAEMANWDVTEWQDLLMRLTTGNVTIQDHS